MAKVASGLADSMSASGEHQDSNRGGTRSSVWKNCEMSYLPSELQARLSGDLTWGVRQG